MTEEEKSQTSPATSSVSGTSTTAADDAAAPAGVACACAIRDKGWWQGSILTTEKLGELLANAGDKLSPTLANDFTHWVMASQTCNLYNTSLEKVRSVEWIGARRINWAADELLDGSDPRVMHCKATNKKGNSEIVLECDIQSRLWTTRTSLANCDPDDYAFRETPNKKTRSFFANWISRSYVRTELSDELGDAFKKSKITHTIKRVATLHKDKIEGIFLKLTDLQGNILGADAIPPCIVDIYFVVSKPIDEGVVTKAHLAENQNKFDFILGDGKKKNITREQAAKELGIDLTYYAWTASRFMLRDVMDSIQYSFMDHLSG